MTRRPHTFAAWTGPALLGVLLAAAPRPSYATPSEARRLNTAADKEFEAASDRTEDDAAEAAAGIRRAAAIYWEAAEALPEVKAHRQTRSNLLGKSVSSYREAQRLEPSRETLEAPIQLLEAYIAKLEQVYGSRAPKLAEHRRAAELLTTLRGELEVFLQEEAARAEARAAAEAAEAAAAEAARVEATVDVAPQARTRQLRIGLGVSGGLTAAAGVAALATGLTLVREPFEGARYREIHEAALATDLQIANGQDYCVAARDQWATQVTEACQAHAATRRAMTGMLVTAGVAAASAIVLAVLLARARRGASTGPTAALHGGTVTLRF